MEDEFLGNGAKSCHFADFGFNRNYEMKTRYATDIPLLSEDLSGQASIVGNRADVMLLIIDSPDISDKACQSYASASPPFSVLRSPFSVS
jgi:hypothetical protein